MNFSVFWKSHKKNYQIFFTKCSLKKVKVVWDIEVLLHSKKRELFEDCRVKKKFQKQNGREKRCDALNPDDLRKVEDFYQEDSISHIVFRK